MEEKGELDHYIGVATTSECPENLSQLEVSATSWAVFDAVGPFPDTLQEIWDGFTPSGFHPLITNKRRDRKFYGMRVKM